jgi:hypothetical protein
MAKTNNYQCPVCASPIDQGTYDRVLRLSEARQAATEEMAAELKAVKRDRARIAERAVEQERNRSVAKEHKLAQTIDQLREQLQQTNERLQQSEARRQRDELTWKRKTAELQRQAETRDRGHFGQEGEDDLEAKLHKAFPSDDIQRWGKKGDVLQVVRENRMKAGTIVYECKNTEYKLEHVRQLKSAMEAHDTGYGILVTRANPTGKGPFFSTRGVLVVEAPIAEHLAEIIRCNLVELARLRLSGQGKDSKAAELIAYARGAEFVNAMTRVGASIRELRESFSREQSSHRTFWDTRDRNYTTILREATGIDDRVKEILQNDLPAVRRAS